MQNIFTWIWIATSFSGEDFQIFSNYIYILYIYTLPKRTASSPLKNFLGAVRHLLRLEPPNFWNGNFAAYFQWQKLSAWRGRKDRVLSVNKIVSPSLFPDSWTPLFQWFPMGFFTTHLKKKSARLVNFASWTQVSGRFFFSKKYVKLPPHILKHLKISLIFSKSTGSNLGTFLNKSWKPECSWGFLGDSLTFHHHFFRWVTHPVGIKGWNFPLPTSDSLRCCKMGEGGGMRPAAARVALPSWRTSSWSENIRSRGFECVSYIFLYVLWGTVYI